VGANQLPHRQNHRHPVVGVVVEGHVDAMAILHLGRRIYCDEFIVRVGLGHPEHDRVSRVAGFSRRLDDPDRVHQCLFYFTGQRRVIAAAVIGTISSAAPTLGPTIGGWITRKPLLALAVLHQSSARNIRRHRSADARAYRPAEPGITARC